MFTGLVETLGKVRAARPDGAGGSSLSVAVSFALEVSLGESVAVNGCCLTVIEQTPDVLDFQCGPETLNRTNLGELQPGDRVNLERSLRAGDRLGGHFVQGHIDAVGRIADRSRQGEWETVWFDCPADLAAQMVPKGSVAVDGISLTLVDVTDSRFSVMLIPHTLAATSLGFKPVGAAVNLETDILGKYVWKQLRELGLQLPR